MQLLERKQKEEAEAAALASSSSSNNNNNELGVRRRKRRGGAGESVGADVRSGPWLTPNVIAVLSILAVVLFVVLLAYVSVVMRAATM